MGIKTIFGRILRQETAQSTERAISANAHPSYSALAISNELTAMGMHGSSMRHNKLVQIIQGNAIALGRNLVPEMPEVWRYGPILASLYAIQQHKGGSTIDHMLSAGPFDHPPRVDPTDVWALNLIHSVVTAYRSISTLDLSSLMHSQESPWRQVAEENNFKVRRGTTIPAWRIHRHFAHRLVTV